MSVNQNYSNNQNQESIMNKKSFAFLNKNKKIGFGIESNFKSILDS